MQFLVKKRTIFQWAHYFQLVFLVSLSLYCLPSSNLLLFLITSSLHYIYLNFQTTCEFSQDLLLFIHYNITYFSYHDKSKRNPLCIEITAVAGSRSLKVRVAKYELRTTETIEEGRKGNRVLSCLPQSKSNRVLSQLCVTVELVV